MKPIGVLDEQRFMIDTLLTSSGTVVRVRYPALGLSRSGAPKQQQQLLQRLRADVARELLTNPRLVREHHRWSRAVDPRHVALIEEAPTLGCDEIEPMLRQESGETLYLVATLAIMRGCELWPIMSARPDALADSSLRALLMEASAPAPSSSLPLDLRQVLREGSLGGLRVGDPIDRIEATLGQPQVPPQRVGRRSKLQSWLYGNVTVLSTAERVEGIEIDFEGSRPRLVDAGDMVRWSRDRWRTFAQEEGLEARERPPVLQLVAEHATIGLDENGALHVVTLRPPSSTPDTLTGPKPTSAS